MTNVVEECDTKHDSDNKHRKTRDDGDETRDDPVINVMRESVRGENVNRVNGM